MRPSPRSKLALALTLCAAACGRSTRKPLVRGDGGPSVVVVDRKNEPAARGPTTPELEPNNLVAQAQPLDDGARIAGLLASGQPLDVDCYRLRAPTQGDLGAPNADAGATPSTLGFVVVTPVDAEGWLALDLLDERGKTIVSRGAPVGQRVTLSFLGLDPAGAVVRVRRPFRSRGTPGSPVTPAIEVSYTLEYTTRVVGPDDEPQPEVEPNDSLARAMLLPPRGTLTGRLDGSDDVDLISLPSLPQGATYRVELAAIAELALEIKLRAGSQTISTARGGKGGELRLRNLPGSALSPLVLQLRSIDGASDTPYTLRVSTEPPLDAGIEREPNDDRVRANAARPGESVAGYLWPGDVDWFCASEPGAIGARVEALPDVDWKLELTDDAGKTIKKVDAGKRGAGEEIAPEVGARCVRLSARARDTAFDAPYRLSFLP